MLGDKNERNSNLAIANLVIFKSCQCCYLKVIDRLQISLPILTLQAPTPQNGQTYLGNLF